MLSKVCLLENTSSSLICPKTQNYFLPVVNLLYAVHLLSRCHHTTYTNSDSTFQAPTCTDSMGSSPKLTLTLETPLILTSNAGLDPEIVNTQQSGKAQMLNP